MCLVTEGWGKIMMGSGGRKAKKVTLVTCWAIIMEKQKFFVDSLKSMDYIESSYDGIDKETENLGNLW